MRCLTWGQNHELPLTSSCTVVSLNQATKNDASFRWRRLSFSVSLSAEIMSHVQHITTQINHDVFAANDGKWPCKTTSHVRRITTRINHDVFTANDCKWPCKTTSHVRRITTQIKRDIFTASETDYVVLRLKGHKSTSWIVTHLK